MEESILRNATSIDEVAAAIREAVNARPMPPQARRSVPLGELAQERLRVDEKERWDTAARDLIAACGRYVLLRNVKKFGDSLDFQLALGTQLGCGIWQTDL